MQSSRQAAGNSQLGGRFITQLPHRKSWFCKLLQVGDEGLEPRLPACQAAYSPTCLCEKSWNSVHYAHFWGLVQRYSSSFENARFLAVSPGSTGFSISDARRASGAIGWCESDRSSRCIGNRLAGGLLATSRRQKCKAPHFSRTSHRGHPVVFHRREPGAR
jgi:hypothetical protein